MQWNEKNKKYYTVGTVLKLNIKIIEIGTIDTLIDMPVSRGEGWFSAGPDIGD
jgi:hypothetical protein